MAKTATRPVKKTKTPAAEAPFQVPPDAAAPTVAALRIDLGCGRVKSDGWVGIDSLDFAHNVIADLSVGPWVFPKDDRLPRSMFDPRTLPDNSVDEARSFHFVEHLTGPQRVQFFNELYRVLKPGAGASIVVPHWSHACAYGDPTHQWPPMSEWACFYLNKAWRDANAPHAGYTCDFDHPNIVGTWDPTLESRTNETKQFMMSKNINSTRDLQFLIVKRAPA